MSVWQNEFVPSKMGDKTFGAASNFFVGAVWLMMLFANYKVVAGFIQSTLDIFRMIQDHSLTVYVAAAILLFGSVGAILGWRSE